MHQGAADRQNADGHRSECHSAHRHGTSRHGSFAPYRDVPPCRRDHGLSGRPRHLTASVPTHPSLPPVGTARLSQASTTLPAPVCGREAVQKLGGRYRGTMLPPSDGPAARSGQQHEALQFLDGLVGWMVARRGRAAERGSDTPALRAVVDADVADRACRLSGGSRSAAAKRPCPTSAPSRRRPWR